MLIKKTNGLRFLNFEDRFPWETPRRINRPVRKVDYIHAARIMHRLGIDPEKATLEECNRAVAEAQAEYLPTN